MISWKMQVISELYIWYILFMKFRGLENDDNLLAPADLQQKTVAAIVMQWGNTPFLSHPKQKQMLRETLQIFLMRYWKISSPNLEKRR